MTDYFVSMTIPADTPVTSPVKLEVTLEGEVLNEIAYLIPPGWCALAHFRLMYGEKQVYPYEPDTWVTGDDLFHRAPLRWRIPGKRDKVRLEGYNEDDTYDHAVYVWLTVEREAEVRMAKAVREGLKEVVEFARRVLGYGRRRR